MSADDDSESGDDFSSGGILSTITPNVIRRSFALKFGIVLLLMGLSVGVIGIAATETVKSETQDNVRDQYRGVALQEGDIIEQWIQRNRLSARLISEDSALAADSGVEAALRNKRSQLPSNQVELHVMQTSLSGDRIYASTSLREEAEVNTIGRSYLETAHENLNRTAAVYVSDVHIVSGGDRRIGFVSPITGTDNRFLVVEYPPDTITESLQGAERADGGFTQVVNADGIIQLDEPRTPNAEGSGGNVTRSYSQDDAALRPLEEGLTLTGQQNAGVITEMEASDVIGERYTVGFSLIEETDWVVLTHAPFSSVFGFVQQIQTWGLIATGGLIVLIGGVGAVLGWSTASSIDRLRRKSERMREGDLEVTVSTHRIDDIGQLYRAFADMRDSLRQQIEDAERARKEAEVSRAEAMEMNNYLQEKAEEFSIVMERAAAGDLTQRMVTDGENEAMDEIANEYNAMIEELEKTTGQLKSFAEEVAESGDIVLSSAESVRDASEQVAGSVQQVSDDAYDQKERLQEVTESLDDLVNTLSELQARHPDVDVQDSLDRFRDVVETLQAAANTSEDMMAESETVAGAAEEQAAELNEVSSRAEQLKRYARPLGDILDRFETEAEHEFVFSGGPSQSRTASEGEDEE